MAVVQGGGWTAQGSALTGQNRHTGQGRQQPGVYVYPTEEYSLVQPFIVVMEQYGCAVHG